MVCSRYQVLLVVDKAVSLELQNSASLNVLLVLLGLYFAFNLRWQNTVLRAISSNLRDGACFKLDKQTWRPKINGAQKTIPQNLLIRIL